MTFNLPIASFQLSSAQRRPPGHAFTLDSSPGKYLGLLEKVFLTHSLGGWHGNALSRLAKRSKTYFYDTGLLAALRGIDEGSVRADRKCLGPLLENFVVAELLRLATWTPMRLRFAYFRDANLNEVDVVIEDGQGRIVAIEVKASATVTSSDFNGIRRLASMCGERLVLGLVLHDSDDVIPFGERLYAAPVSTLW